MSEPVINLISAIASGDALETENAFNVAMAEKISARLDALRIDVAQNMFKAESGDDIEPTDSADATITHASDATADGATD